MWRYWRLEGGEHFEESLQGIEGAWTWEPAYQRAFPNAVEQIVSMLDGEVDNPSTGEEATRSLEIIVAFYLSHGTEGEISLPLEHPLRDVIFASW